MLGLLFPFLRIPPSHRHITAPRLYDVYSYEFALRTDSVAWARFVIFFCGSKDPKIVRVALPLTTKYTVQKQKGKAREGWPSIYYRGTHSGKQSLLVALRMTYRHSGSAGREPYAPTAIHLIPGGSKHGRVKDTRVILLYGGIWHPHLILCCLFDTLRYDVHVVIRTYVAPRHALVFPTPHTAPTLNAESPSLQLVFSSKLLNGRVLGGVSGTQTRPPKMC